MGGGLTDGTHTASDDAVLPPACGDETMRKGRAPMTHAAAAPGQVIMGSDGDWPMMLADAAAALAEFTFRPRFGLFRPIAPLSGDVQLRAARPTVSAE